jgi:predicted Zn-dependent peptidase
VAPETLEAALHDELDRLTADGPTDDDLERVRNLHASRISGSLERISERADRLSMYTCLFDQPERINDEISRYSAVDAGRVQEAMGSWIRPENRVTLTYIPAETDTEPAAEDAA